MTGEDHIKTMTELFNELSIVGDAISDDDRIVYLLSSLPGSYGTLVTALKANKDVPKMETVTARLFHAERKQKETIVKKRQWQLDSIIVERVQCGKLGHIKRNCRSVPEQRKSINDDKVKAYGYKH